MTANFEKLEPSATNGPNEISIPFLFLVASGCVYYFVTTISDKPEPPVDYCPAGAALRTRVTPCETPLLRM